MNTIDDAYSHYVDLCGSSKPSRSRDEIREAIHESGLRYEELESKGFWSSMPDDWMLGISDDLSWTKLR